MTTTLAPKITKALSRRISKAITSLPSEWLRHLCDTEEQLHEWENQKFLSQMQSACWDAFFHGEDDPLTELVGTKHEWIRDAVWLKVEAWVSLWGLIQIGEPHIQPELEACGIGFVSAVDLFLELVKIERDGIFVGCLRPWQVYSFPKAGELATVVSQRLQAKGEPINKPDELKFKKLSSSLKNPEHKAPELRGLEKNALLITIVALLEHKAKRSIALKARLEAYFNTLAKLAEHMASTSRRNKSFAWKGGEIKLANGKGGAY